MLDLKTKKKELGEVSIIQWLVAIVHSKDLGYNIWLKSQSHSKAYLSVFPPSVKIDSHLISWFCAPL